MAAVSIGPASIKIISNKFSNIKVVHAIVNQNILMALLHVLTLMIACKFRNDNYFEVSNEGCSALMLAFGNGHTEIAEFSDSDIQ